MGACGSKSSSPDQSKAQAQAAVAVVPLPLDSQYQAQNSTQQQQQQSPDSIQPITATTINVAPAPASNASNESAVANYSSAPIPSSSSNSSASSPASTAAVSQPAAAVTPVSASASASTANPKQVTPKNEPSKAANPPASGVAPAQPNNKSPPSVSSSASPVISSSTPKSSSSSSQTDVFLGGSCHPTTWRRDIAMPMLSRFGVRFYNPQVDDWSEELIAIESKAKEEAAILFFVIDSETRALASIVECTEYLCSGREVVLVIRRLVAGGRIGGELVGNSEMKDLNRARAYIEELAKRHGTAVYPTVEVACEEIIRRVGARRKLVEVKAETSKSTSSQAAAKSQRSIDSTETAPEDSTDPTSQPSSTASASASSASSSGQFDSALHAKADRKAAALQAAAGANFVSISDIENADSVDPLSSIPSQTSPNQGVSLPLVDVAKLRMSLESS